MAAYYNEIDPYAAQWLRNLIANKLIADGDVDERSIRDVAAADLRGYAQCHFFAGIGVWSHALRLAGWPDNRPVWTGSCPCQPFSAAGKGAGFADDRHLWPEFYRLIAECAPPVVFGEQVASKDGLNWLDTVFADLEASGYAAGAADLCAAGVGAPHIRQRLWFVGERLDDTAGTRHVGALAGAEGEARNEARLRVSGERSGSGGLADAEIIGRQSRPPVDAIDGSGVEPRGREPVITAAGVKDADKLEHAARNGRHEWRPEPSGRGAAGGRGDGGLADTDSEDQRGWGIQRPGQGDGAGDGAARERPAGLRADGGLADTDNARLEGRQRVSERARECVAGAAGVGGGVADSASIGREVALQHTGSGQSQAGVRQADVAGSNSIPDGARPTNGHWRAADWLYCRDGKWRPVEPGTFPLAYGAPARVGRLRAYGNAIVPQVAAEVIGAYLDARP